MGPDNREPGRAKSCVQLRELAKVEREAAEPPPACPHSQPTPAGHAHPRSEPLTKEPREQMTGLSCRACRRDCRRGHRGINTKSWAVRGPIRSPSWPVCQQTHQ